MFVNSVNEGPILKEFPFDNLVDVEVNFDVVLNESLLDMFEVI